MALARRHVLKPLIAPSYEFSDVPFCNREDLLKDSILLRIDSREKWLEILPELLLVCNEATLRTAIRAQKKRMEIVEAKQNGHLKAEERKSPAEAHSKPLSLEYIADRLDLDDPLFGYVVRDKGTGWLQGFITLTTFTTWQKWFRWDSLADEAGVLLFEEVGKGLDALHELGIPYASAANEEHTKHSREWWFDRLVDADGSLAAALNSELRDGDPDDEGVIWPHIAELSLLGALGCGSYLVDLVVKELEKEQSPYNYIVLQSTENSIPFYEKKGFIRVGAVARYFSSKSQNADEVTPECSNKKTQRKQSSNKRSRQGSKKRSIRQITKNRTQKSPSKSKTDEDRFLIGSHLEFSSEVVTVASKHIPKHLKVPGPSSPYYWHTVDRTDTPQLFNVASKLNLLPFDLLFFNKRLYPDLKIRSRLKDNMLLRIPLFPKGFDSLRQKPVSTSSPLQVRETKAMVQSIRRKGQLSSSELWYCTREYDSPLIVAKKLKTDADKIVAENKFRYPDLETSSRLLPGTVLRLPSVRPSIQKLPAESLSKLNPLVKHEKDEKTENLRDNSADESNIKTEGSSEDNSKGMEGKDYTSEDELLIETRRNQIQMDWGFFDKTKNEPGEMLSDPMCYRHWSFSDDPIEFTHASYMMARVINKKSSSPKSEMSANVLKSNMEVQCFNYRKYNEPMELLLKTYTRQKNRTVEVVTASEEVEAKAEIDLSNVIVGSRRREKTKDSALVTPENKNPIKSPITTGGTSKLTPKKRKRKEQNHSSTGEPDPESPTPVQALSLSRSATSTARRSHLVIKSSLLTRSTQSLSFRPLMAFVNKDLLLVETENPDEAEKQENKTENHISKDEPESPVSKEVLEDDSAKSETPILSKDSSVEQGQDAEHSQNQQDKLTAQKEPQEQVNSLIKIEPSSPANCPEPNANIVRDHRVRVILDNVPVSIPLFAQIPFSIKWPLLAGEARIKELLLQNGGSNFFNKVVKVMPMKTAVARNLFFAENPENITEQFKHIVKFNSSKDKERQILAAEYYYVITYIPDLQWLRLAPLQQDGYFPVTHDFCPGKPRWKCIPESEGHEIDVSAKRCYVVNSKATERSTDADHERWYIDDHQFN